MALRSLILTCLLLPYICYASFWAFSPDRMRQEFREKYGASNAIPSSLANFGNPPYGTTMVGRVFYYKQDQLEDPDDANHLYACERIRPIDWTDDPDRINSPILMVDRGKCTFVQKVRHAQDIGAAAVIVADNTDENIDNIVMSDDGTGDNLFIPSILISKEDANIIKRYIADNASRRHVAMSIHFDMKRSNKVDYTIWMSSEEEEVRALLNDMEPLVKPFKEEELSMTPHYVLWRCQSCAPDYRNDTDDCVSGGQYCAPDPDGDGRLTGRDVVMEDLRQICIYKQSLERNKPHLWWDYVSVFYNNCPLKEFTEACSKKAMKAAKVKQSDVERCVADSFDDPRRPELSENALLYQERKLWRESGVFFQPSLQINNQTYRGDIESDAVMTAICAGYSEWPKPCWPTFQKGHRRHHSSSDTNEGLNIWTIITIIVASLLCLVLILYLYRRWIRREVNHEMKLQVSNAVSQYIALSESRGS